MCTKKSLFLILLGGLLMIPFVRAEGVDLKRDGAFGFPQAQARILCDQENLRVSVWSNAEYLYVQAIVWADSDDAIGEINGREVGDATYLSLDIDADQQRTPTIDRSYSISMSPSQHQGFQYSVVVSERGSTRLQNDSAGRGAIKYVEGIDGKRCRVDSFLIPLAEIGKKSGESIRLAYWTRSPKPEFIANSVGFESAAAYFPQALPFDKYHAVTLVEGAAIDLKLVPDGRDDAAAQPTEPAPTAPTLTIGSRAPALDIEHWVQNGKGKFERVTEFASGKVYIVEFWATWCGPCIAAMPHIVELQNKYADQGMQVVSISDEKLDIVEKFLEGKAPAQKDKEPVTFGELTSQYCLTTDPDGSNHTNYLKAAGQNGIPCAFVVGKDGFIEWIGHPMSIDKALANIIEGNWDRDAFVVEYKQGLEIRQKSTEIMSFAQTGRFEKSFALANELLENSSTQNGKLQVESLIRFVRSSEVEQHILKNSDQASAKLESLLEGRSPLEVNNFVWYKIVLVKEKGRKISDEVLATASRLTEKAVVTTPEESYLLDTYAHLLHIQGQLDKAIEVQERAVKFMSDKNRESVEDFLHTLLKSKDPSEAKKPEVVTVLESRRFDGHTDKATSVAFSPDGRKLISSSDDITMRLWDVETGKTLKTFSGHESMVLSAAFTPDGQRFLTSSGWPPNGPDNSLRLWDVETAREIWKGADHSDTVWRVSISADGTRGLSTSRDLTIGLWDLQTGKLIKRFTGHTAWVRGAVFVPNQDLAVSGGWDKTVRVWSLSTGQEVRRLDGHTSQVQDVAVSPDGTLIASCSGLGASDTSVRLWNLKTGDEIRQLKGNTGRPWTVGFSPDGKKLLCGGDDKIIRVWDVQTGELVARLEGHTDTVRQVAFSADGRFAASASHDKTIRLWKLPEASLVIASEALDQRAVLKGRKPMP